MAANPTPTSNPVLLALCDRVAGGLQALETEVGIKQHTEAKLRADMAAASAASAAVGQAKVALGEARKTYRGADAKGEKVISDCRLRLARFFGARHNVWWEGAGFSGRSTAVPEVAAARLSLLSYLAAYFKQNPDKESVDMGATAAICHATHEALSDARSAVNRAKSTRRAAVRAKQAAWRQLRKRMRGVVQELKIVLPETDARWLRFGLQIPARTPMPEKVSGVTLQLLAGGSVLIEWPPAAHARRYRVQMKREGLDTDFINVKTLKDTSHLLRSQPGTQALAIRIIAANKTGEAGPSPVARVVV